MQIDWINDAEPEIDGPVFAFAPDCVTVLVGIDVEPHSAPSFPDLGFLSVIQSPADTGNSLTIETNIDVAVSAAPDPMELGGASQCVWSTEAS